MSKTSNKSNKSSKSIDLEKKVTGVWLVQGQNRFLLNFFPDFEMARKYERSFRHMRINGELLLGEVSLKYLVEGGNKIA